MMTDYEKLGQWVLDALEANGGEASVINIAKHIWEQREPELRRSGDMFYRWQYSMRWEAQKLQKKGLLVKDKANKTWRLAKAKEPE